MASPHPRLQFDGSANAHIREWTRRSFWADVGIRAPVQWQFHHACKRAGARPTRFLLIVSVETQSVCLFERKPARALPVCNSARHYQFVKKFRCSTSRFGTGQMENSNRTPLGLHRIVQKIGGGWPAGTVFKGRRPIGFTWKGMPQARITSRILWLEGLEAGLNHGGQVDSHARYIYIHGTGDETTIGRPDSCGCVHLSANDLIPLYNLLPSGTLVWIAA